MNTGKNRVKGLKTELFKKKYQTDPIVKNPTDMLGIPDITKDISKELGYKSTPYDWGTPQEDPNIQRENPPGFMAVNIDTKAEKTTPDSDSNTKVVTPPDLRNYLRMGVGLTSAVKGIYDDVQNRQDVNQRIQNLNDRPRYMPNEYEYMGRPGSQSVIYAKHGAEIRTGTESGAEEAELERGEMFMLPNMDSYIVGGKKHSQGGEDFVLPQGTIVFSDHLKVPGLKNTFAEQAKKFDITKYKEVLENPHSKSVDRTTAEVMMDRNLKKLQELFQIQQAMNGNSNGEMEPEAKRMAQKGMFYNPNPDEVAQPELLNQVNQLVAKAEQGIPNSSFAEQKQSFVQPGMFDGVENAAKAKIAAEANPNPGSVLGGTASSTPQTASEIAGATQADATSAGTVAKTNAADPNSLYYKTLPNGKKVFVEGQGEFKGKSLRDQYGGDVFNLVRNRLNEYGNELEPSLLSAYKLHVGNDKLMVGNANQLVDIMEGGNNSLVAMRDFYKGINMEDVLFNPELDRSMDDNEKQKKTVKLFKDYVESAQYMKDVASGKASTYIPWLKTQPTPIKNDKGNITGYKLDADEMNLDYTKQYQAAYKAFGAVKKTQSGKSTDMLRGFRIAPEGLADHMWMNLPISPVDAWGGNTTIGQISAFEDEEPQKPKTPPGTPVKEKDKGKDYNTKLTGAPTGQYTKAPFDYPQLAPEIYGMANSQMFPYAPMDYNAPYLMPQTLNIQPQLQDVDNSYMAAINAGADPNSALIATLGAKQKLYSEKQNFDAQQRAATDQYNANARWQEDVYDMQSLDRVYNTLIAGADDAVTAQRQALVAAASKKRAVYNMEENKKKLYIENFVRNYKVDGKTGAITVATKEGYDPLNIASLAELAYNQSTTQSNTASNTSTTK